jgi:hypothetical protein
MKIKPIFLLLLTLNTTASLANDMRWSVKGFGTFGFIQTDTDKVGFLRATTQTQDATKSGGVTTDSRLGVQVDVDINPSLHATVQWTARDHAGDFFEQNLDWTFLRWNFDQNSSVRIGRMAVDLFLLSDYREVGYAYPWMRPPHEFYNNLALYHFDGLDLSHKIYFDDTLLSIKLFSGYSFNQAPSTYYESQTIDFEVALVGGNVKLESGNWTARAGYSYSQALSNIKNGQLEGVLNDPAVVLGIPGIDQVKCHTDLKGANIHYYSLGVAYDDGSWLSQAEASYVNSDTVYLPDTVSGYWSIGKRISKVTLYSLFGISYSFQKDIAIPSPVIPSAELQRLSLALDRVVNKNGTDEKSISLGVRWDFHPKFALKTQWSHYWLGENGTQFWQDPTMKDKSHQVNVWSLGVDFTF